MNDGREKPIELSKTVQIINDLGLHARAAAVIARKARSAVSGIKVIKDGKTADAESIIDLLTLECPKGAWITITSGDPADHPILMDILQSVESGFGE